MEEIVMTHNIQCRIPKRNIVKYALIFFTLCFYGNLCAFSQQSNNSSFTFESFLTTNLTIANVVFTRETFLPKSLRNKFGNNLTEKGVYLVRTSGNDYLLSVLKHNAEIGNYSRAGVDAGRFNGTTWHDVHNTLVLADSKSGQIDPQDEAIRASICMISKLGIGALFKSDSFTYDKHDNRLEVVNSNIAGGKALIQLIYSNGVVNTAIIKADSNNEMVNRVTYSYDTNFNSGKFPVEYSSFLEAGGVVTKLFTIHILQLSITNGILPAAMIDPVLALNSTNLTILTSKNGSLFTQDGKRVLTTKEIFNRKPNVTKHLIYIRIIMGLVLASGLLIILVQSAKQKTK